MNKRTYRKRLHIYILVLLFGLVTSLSKAQNDTTKSWNPSQPALNQDSINARLKFIQDSILAREKFVRDSIMRRKQILDSLTFLQGELQSLFQAYYWTTSDDIISGADKIAIIGDTILGDYVYHKLPLTLNGPYIPWKGRLSLNAKQFRLTIDKKVNKITTIQGPLLTCGFNYASQGFIIVIREDYMLQKNSSGNFYRFPVDSVFFDRNKRIVKIKRYVQFYNLLPNNKKGELLLTNLSQVKQFQYDNNNLMNKYELVKFCDRYKSYDKNDVCSIINYTIAKQNNSYMITRRNNPENEFSDGTFTLETDELDNIKNMSFRLLSNTLVWQRIVEMNKDGNVNCYIDKKSGVTASTQCMIYHHEPNAKYPVEIITTAYDKDGIDYMQTNLTTEKTRLRNKLTLEWGPWK